ncbi:hypothetical protein BT96DRAFT_1034641 [Gymnopus androsaceus JB14]|uniref:C2H2-type domain-containing protein n=1 Tax=Gymnopus androsaceus JB14 TaxID=1447944 RepID=A0A6A4HL39_9AGAR|nr:hypothetical protein BT96DRAFT_1034641 [Gymnopus androsaceus JB14]
MPTTCKSCRKVFSDAGYMQHIRTTQKKGCAALQNETESFETPLDLIRTMHGLANDEVSPEVESDGDYFGDYANSILDQANPDSDACGMGTRKASSDARVQDDHLDILMADVESPMNDESEGNGGSEDEDGYASYSDLGEDELEFELAEAAACENSWEPLPPSLPPSPPPFSCSPSPTDMLSDHSRSPSPPIMLMDDLNDVNFPVNPRLEAKMSLPAEPHIEHYPDIRAGKPVGSRAPEHDHYHDRLHAADVDNPWRPFKSELDWHVACWAKTRGPSSTALTELLSIPGLCEKLGLSYKSAKELNKVIDESVPVTRPPFEVKEVVVQGEAFEVYYRNITLCVQALYSEPEFTKYMKYAPEKHYTDSSLETRMYHDMHTGKWWWTRQEALDRQRPGGTIIPIILSTDKTLVTTFCGKSAYPIYLTIGNIPKEIRRKPSSRAYILIGYLPTSKLEHITNKASRRRTLANLFHKCMGHIVSPLKSHGANGIVLAGGDGAERRTHALLAAYCADYPEQVLISCCTSGDCAECEILKTLMGNDTTLYPIQDLLKILRALDKFDSEGPLEFREACSDAGIKPIYNPFWKDLPYSNIYRMHSAGHLASALPRLPPNHHVCLFMKGISSLSRITGQEHNNDISRFLLSIIIDIPLPGQLSAAQLLWSMRGLVDVLYLAHYPIQTDKTLALFHTALEQFHDNKQILIDLGVRNDFHFPQLHFLNHYVEKAEFIGTFDNTNTEHTERLHIDLAKDAYHATNSKDEYPQMTIWLEHKEKVLRHDCYLRWLHDGKPKILPN